MFIMTTTTVVDVVIPVLDAVISILDVVKSVLNIVTPKIKRIITLNGMQIISSTIVVE